jgi:hypothetical protein
MPFINYYNSSFSLLYTGSSFPTQSNSPTFGLTFNAPTNVTIDFGNGVSKTYATILNNVLLQYNVFGISPYAYPAYIYPDGLTIQRRITINISNADNTKLIGLNITAIPLIPQFLGLSFNIFPNFQTLNLTLLNNGLLGFDQSFLTLSSFTNYTVSNSAIASTSENYGKIPYIVLAKSSLQTLGVGDPGFRTKSFADNNMDKIAGSYPTLKTLSITQAGFTDNHFGDGPLPSNLTTMTTLQTLYIHAASYTTIPSILNDIPNYTSLAIYYTVTITNWGDLSGVAPRLKSLNVTGNNNLPAELPGYFSLMTFLKTFSWGNIGHGTANIDTFINSWYNLIIGNAAIIGSTTLPFRGITLIIRGDIAVENGTIPNGVYQQPAGYVQGVSNGMPISSQEQLWVLANQYSHQNIYRTI